MAATMSRACATGVARSAPPLMTIVFATMDARASYWLYRFRAARKPAAVLSGVVRIADAVSAAAPLSRHWHIWSARHTGAAPIH